MYSFVREDDTYGRTAKGINKNIIKNRIKHEDYGKALFSDEQIRHKMKTIRSQKYQISSFEINKISLSCFDDKRYIERNGISSRAYGHYSIT